MSLRQAQELVTTAPLRFVRVFQNQKIDFIVKIANQLQRRAVQLHACSKMRNLLPQYETRTKKNTQIWKAISVNTEQSAVDFTIRFECRSLYF